MLLLRAALCLWCGAGGVVLVLGAGAWRVRMAFTLYSVFHAQSSIKCHVLYLMYLLDLKNDQQKNIYQKIELLPKKIDLLIEIGVAHCV